MFFGGQGETGKNVQQGKVLMMDRFRSRSSLSPLRQAEAYWTALRRGDEIPSRSQVDPRGLENILSNTFILERVAPGIARFRLAGQKVNELAGMEVRGMPLTAFFTIEGRKTVSAALENMFDEPAIVEMELETEATRLRGSRSARMILLPLRSDLGDVSRALGVLVSDSSAASRISQRFNVTSCDMRPVAVNAAAGKTSAGGVAPAKAPVKAPAKPPVQPAAQSFTSVPKVNSAPAGMAEAQTPFAGKSSPSLMDEARALLDRARGELDRPLASDAAQPGPRKSGQKPGQKSGQKPGLDLVARAPRNAKLDGAAKSAAAKSEKKPANHLRLVYSRD